MTIKKSNKNKIIAITVCALAALCFCVSAYRTYSAEQFPRRLFKVQSIDTMKYSRDMARSKMNDPYFSSVIDTQMSLIAAAGATHVAIDTPYDPEFIPMLTRWVASARAHNLSVWFRGNFSGWEGWFGYGQLSEDAHAQMLDAFIRNNPSLFRDGDIFTPCPECENGMGKDPRNNGNASGYNSFLVREYTVANNAFRSIGVSVTQYVSMNGDIASYVLDKQTAVELGGHILIDHYVSSPKTFADDIVQISKRLGVNVSIGEFGAPVPDLNGDMTQDEQAAYIEQLFSGLYSNAQTVSLVNYWDLQGGSTAVVNDDGTPRKAYSVIKSYFKAPAVSGVVVDPLGEYVSGATVSVAGSGYKVITSASGVYKAFLPAGYRTGTVTKEGYAPVTVDFSADLATTSIRSIVLQPQNPSWEYQLKKWIRDLFI